ncbi:VWA domain-containing protein [Actinoplanes sp. NPDC049599]|uniref:VWA domain-containing protein n=1 Tax=Actinoplanes sp. NPDC049599 TaxID=3363903 RepID=UPI0037984487
MSLARRRVTSLVRRTLALAAAGAVLIPAGPADAAPAQPVDVVVSGVQPSVGAVEFFVAARGLPAGQTLSAAQISVTAAGTPLPATVRFGAAAGRDSPTSAVVLVIDTSGSMAGERLTAARAAAVDYAATAPKAMMLGLVTVADRPTIVLPPTADRATFTAAVARLSAGGGTALYDGIQAAVQLLDPAMRPAAADFVERRLVVLTDGADTASKMTGDRLTRALKRSSAATIDAVAFGGGTDRTRLTDLTAMTGGRVFDAADPAALRSTFITLAAGLSAPVVVTATVPPSLSGRSSLMSVRVSVGGVVADADVPVVFRPDPRAAPPRTSFTATRAGNVGLLATLSLVAAALLAAGFLVVSPVTGRNHVRRRLQDLDRFTTRGVTASAGRDDTGKILRAALAVSERAVTQRGRRARIELALDRAGLQLRASEWQLIQIGAAAAGAASLAFALPWWVGLPTGLLLGWFAAGFYLRQRAGRRTRLFAEQLPDALQLVVGSLRAGFSLPQSIDALVREGSEPVAGELGRALAETRLDGDLEDALERVGQRNDNQDLAWLVMAIRIQREVGGNLSEVLETAVDTMRDRARLGRHVLALSAEGRLSARILLAMPILLGGWMFAFRREYLEPLYTQPLGILMLGTSVAMIGVGGLWLRKIVQVRV